MRNTLGHSVNFAANSKELLNKFLKSLDEILDEVRRFSLEIHKFVLTESVSAEFAEQRISKTC